MMGIGETMDAMEKRNFLRKYLKDKERYETDEELDKRLEKEVIDKYNERVRVLMRKGFNLEQSEYLIEIEDVIEILMED
jgi:hypothetical protein